MSPVRKALLQIHFCVLLWGFTAILGKLISLPALELVWWRMLLVVAVLLAWPPLWRELRRRDARTLAILAGIGVIVALHWLTFYGAIKLAKHPSRPRWPWDRSSPCSSRGSRRPFEPGTADWDRRGAGVVQQWHAGGYAAGIAVGVCRGAGGDLRRAKQALCVASPLLVTGVELAAGRVPDGRGAPGRAGPLIRARGRDATLC
jgi:hypothetical protein